MKGSGGAARAAAINHGNQMNPKHQAYHSSRASTTAANNNHKNQMNPNNPAYYSSRGITKPESSFSTGYVLGGYDGIIPTPPQEWVTGPVMTNEEAWKLILKGDKTEKKGRI